jgi:hypothetical protein
MCARLWNFCQWTGVIEEHYVSESAMQIVTVYIYVRVIIVRITTIIIILWHIFYAPSAKIGFFLDRCSIYTIRIWVQQNKQIHFQNTFIYQSSAFEI